MMYLRWPYILKSFKRVGIVMYYVSKVDGAGHVFITDTEDGVEEYLTRDQIKQAVRSGLEIQGVNWYTTRSGGIYLDCTACLPSSQGRARYLLAYGIDISVSPEGEALHLEIKNPVTKEIVLSRFCSSVGPNVITNVCEDVCLIFDDNLKSVDKRWCMTHAYVRFDVTQVTREDLLLNIVAPLNKYGRRIGIDGTGQDRIRKYGQVWDMLRCAELDTRGDFVFQDKLVIKYCKSKLIKSTPGVKLILQRSDPRGINQMRSYGPLLVSIVRGEANTSDKFLYDSLKHICVITGAKKALGTLMYVVYGGTDKDIKAAAVKTANMIGEACGLYIDGHWRW